MKKTKRLLAVILTICLITTIITSSISQVSAETATEEFALGALEDTMVPVFDSSASDLPCSTSQTLPSSVDLSESNSFPCVRSQGFYIGSCAAWATTYYQFGYQVAAMNDWNAKYDTTKQFSPKWTYNLINGGNNSGSSVSNANELLKLQGAVRFSEFTPSGANTVSEYRAWHTNTSDIKNALRYRVSDYKKYNFSDNSVNTPITSYNGTSLSVMKSLLNSGFVLTFTTDFYTWDYQMLTSASGSSHVGEKVCIKQYNANGDRDGHAMAIVGYDDTIKYDLNGDGVIQNYEKGAFKIVNSHGTDYQNGGFVWVMYDALNRVSNAGIQNVSGRCPIFENYSYFVMIVQEYPLDLVAQVSIMQTKRNQINLKLGISSATSTTPLSPVDTLLKNSGGAYNFSGTGTTLQTAMFAFDFGSVIEHPTDWKNYYYTITDTVGDSGTAVIEFDIVDSSGKYVVRDLSERTISGTTKSYRYKLAMVGDVDNSGSITINDVNMIQRHLSKTVLLTDEEQLVADVDGDGQVKIYDVQYIQRVLAQLDSGFANGVYVCLN